jgi:bacterioferritin
MQGNEKVLASLKTLVQTEFTAMAQYRASAQILRNAGYKGLKHKLHGFFYDENDHSKMLLNRLMILGGESSPKDYVADEPKVVTDVVAIFSALLALEVQSIADYNDAIALASDVKDANTEDILEEILCEEEKHAAWFDKQLRIISDIGRPNYLAQYV